MRNGWYRLHVWDNPSGVTKYCLAAAMAPRTLLSSGYFASKTGRACSAQRQANFSSRLNGGSLAQRAAQMASAKPIDSIIISSVIGVFCPYRLTPPALRPDFYKSPLSPVLILISRKSWSNISFPVKYRTVRLSAVPVPVWLLPHGPAAPENARCIPPGHNLTATNKLI